MSKMGQELDRVLDENKYEMLQTLRDIKDKLRAGFSCNPDTDSAEVHVAYLHGLWESCERKIDIILNKVGG